MRRRRWRGSSIRCRRAALPSGQEADSREVHLAALFVVFVGFDDAADDVESFFGAAEEGFCFAELFGWNDDDEADAHVECSQHFVLRDLSELLQVLEDGQDWPRAHFNLGGCAFGQDAGQVFGDAAAGDVGHAGGEAGVGQFLGDGQIAAMDLHEGCAGFVVDGSDVLAGFVAGYLEEELAGEGIAVGVEAGGGQADEDVAGSDGFAGDEFGFVDGSDDEAGEIVFAILVEAGHLGGFAADQGAAVGFASLGEAGDDLLGDGRIEFAGGEVVQKEERELRPGRRCRWTQ